MKKKILLGIIIAIAVMCLFAITSSAVEVDGVHYNIDTVNKVASVSKENRTATTQIVTIPSTFEYEGVTYKVTSILNDAFYDNTTMTELRILSEYITKIPASMIANTYSTGALKKIYIDFSNITEIGSAGLNPSNQTNGNGPVSNSFYYYDAKAFIENGTDVIITEPDFSNCTSIGTAAFQGANFEKVTIPAAVYVNNQMFRKSTIKELVIEGEDRTAIEYYSFQDCRNLEKITIKSKKLKSIGNDVFSCATALKEIHIDLSKCESVNASAFQFANYYDSGNNTVQWYNLEGKKIVDLSSMKNFYNRAFCSSNIGSATIIWPNAIEKLEDQAFRKCNIVNQPMLINAAEGSTLSLTYYAFDGNNPSVFICNEGVTTLKNRFDNCKVVLLAPTVNITGDGDFRGENGVVYYKSLAEGSKTPSCTSVQMTGATVQNYGLCGVVANVTTASGNVTVGTVDHDYEGVADQTVCPAGSLVIYTCAGCKDSYREELENYKGGTHVFDRTNGATVVDVIFGAESYFGEGVVVVKCANCDAQANDEEKVGALFIADGYSIPEYGTTDCISHTIRVNKANIARYEELTGNTVNYGITAGVKTSISNPISIKNDKVVANDYAVSADMTGTEYTKLVIKITGLTKNDQISCNAYIVFNVDPTKIYYLCDDEVLTEAAVKSL